MNKEQAAKEKYPWIEGGSDTWNQINEYRQAAFTAGWEAREQQYEEENKKLKEECELYKNMYWNIKNKQWGRTD